MASETGEAAWLYTEENGYLVILDQEFGSNAIKTLGHLGKCSYMHTQAAGKAMLAHLLSDRVTAIIETHGLPAQTDQTITDRDKLLEELETVRERGYSTNLDELVRGVRGVSAPPRRRG